MPQKPKRKRNSSSYRDRAAAAETTAPSLSERIDEKFGAVVGFMAGILFVEVLQFEKDYRAQRGSQRRVSPSLSWYWSSVPSSSPSTTGS